MSSSDAFSIRAARREDLPAIVGMLANDPLGQTRERYHGDGERNGNELSPSYYRAFEEIERDPRNILAVAEQAGQVVSTLQLTFIPNLTYEGGERAQIEAVRVDSRLRGQGLGRQMITWAIERARARGCVMVQLTTNKRRPEALAFYKGLGFEASHEGMKLRL